MKKTPSHIVLPKHEKEAERLAALASYDILDTPFEKEFDDIVQLASRICDMPVSIISLVAENRQWFKSRIGADIRETGLEVSFCAHAILESEFLEVPDATKDPRFNSNPLVTGEPFLRSYTGAVLRTTEGLPLGTLCVVDFKPRTLDENQRVALKTLADQVMVQLELRRALKNNQLAKEKAEKDKRTYETIMQNTPDLVYVIGLDKKFSYANAALLTMWGRSEEDSIGKTLTELGYEDWHVEMHEREIDEVVATKESIRGEVPFEGAHGRRIYEYIFSPIIGVSGEVEGIAGTTRDVTERKINEQQLLESRSELQHMTDAIPQQVWTARPDGQLDYINQHTRDYVGDIAIVDGVVDWMGVVHPDDLQNSTKIWKRSLETGEAYECQQRIIHKNSGAYRWNLSRARAIRAADGTITKWLGTNTDIQDEKLAAETISEAREHLSLMVESAQDYAIVSMNEKGVIVSWSNGAQRIFGFDTDEVIGRPVSVIFTPEDREHGVPEHELSTAASEGRASDERWHLRKNGERFYVSGIMASMKDAEGKVKGFIKIARDMTQERHAQEALVEARNAAEAANIAKTEFLANMSHEIRTPMNAVIGLSNILAISQPLTPKQKEYIKTLQMSADSLLALINDLLDIAKIEARTVDLEKVPFSLTRIMQEIISMMGVRVREKGLTFTGEGDCVERRMFMGDPTRLRQIILNLCSNAIKFTDKGGVHIGITCHLTDTPGVEMISISVRDTGIGIVPEKLETIFQKFVQADSSINRKYGGTGLGLAITKTLAEIMGGTLKVESEPGVGSTFTASIPLESATDHEVQTIGESLPELFSNSFPVQVRHHVLLVEDYAANVMVATSFLEQFGYNCDVAVNGLEAIEKVKTGRYAVVLMDVQMYGMNGLEATQYIREYEKQNKLPRLHIIGMTAHALAGDRERCIGAGMDDYIAKPFNPQELKEKIAAVVSQHKSPAA